jgi:hypothetical protein
MTMSSRCPRCGGPLHEERLGVRLTPVKTRILDAIARAGDTGIASDDLRTSPSATAPTGPARGMSTKSTMHWPGSDWRIRSVERRYRLTKGNDQ